MEAQATDSTTAGVPNPTPRFPERPVFVADRGRRNTLMRAMVLLGIVLAATWLIALAVSVVGWGRLPGLPFSATGADHAQSAFSAGQGKPAAERAAQGGRGATSTGGRVHSAIPGAVFPMSRGPRSPIGASSTPAGRGASAIGEPRRSLGSGSHSPAGLPSTPSGSGVGTGSQQSADPTGGSQGRGAKAAGNGPGSGPGHGGGSAPPASGEPETTSSGKVPAEDAHGGNPNAPAYGRGETPTG